MNNFELKKLPLENDVETKIVLKKVASAHRALAELKGIVSTIPNENISINTLGLQEAIDSSGIENIITTQDDIYKAALNLGVSRVTASKYLNQLSKDGLLKKEKLGTGNYYINERLFEILKKQ